MYIVGLTGGISTGKSTVSKIFVEHGIPVIDADVIARKVVEPGQPAWKKIHAEFGKEVFDENGELNRVLLGKIIFDDIEKRKLLNKITHPEIHKNMLRQAAKYLLQGHKFIVLDLPLLFESGKMRNWLHKIITVSCEEDLQLIRLMDRNQLSEFDAKKRISAQMPLEQKCDQSDFVIENSGSLADTRDQTIRIIGVLRASRQHLKLRGIVLATATIIFSGLAWLLNRKYKFIQS